LTVMRQYTWQDIQEARTPVLRNVSLTIGVFDGLHLGHRALIRRVVENPGNYLPLVITFRENPAKILHGDEYRGDILTASRKIRKLEALGVRAVVLIDFSYDFSRISAKDFFNRITAAFGIKEMVVGYNFHFGHNQGGDIALLKSLTAGAGIGLEIVMPVRCKEQNVSSTRIREAISRGMFDEVVLMLGDTYTVLMPQASYNTLQNGSVVFNRAAFTQILPKSGRYLCEYNPGMHDNSRGVVEINDKEIICTADDGPRLKSLRFITSIAQEGNEISSKEGVSDGTHKKQEE
jgi:riboflavin kinase/FMN adenylyltransferase